MSQFKLQLDASALNTLFPEGSEARLELQRAVMVTFTRQHIKASLLGDHVQKLVEKERRAAVDEVSLNLGFESLGWNKGYRLTDAMKTKVREQAIMEGREQIEQEVSKAMEGATSMLDKKIENYVDRAIAQGAQSIVKQKLDAAMRVISS